MVREIEYPVRGVKTKARYEEHELSDMAILKSRILALSPGEERTKLMAELEFIHELKATFNARILDENDLLFFS